MSYQVGLVCYASLNDAGLAACAAFNPVTAITNNGTQIQTVSCQSSSVEGVLQLSVSTVPVSGGAAIVNSVSMPIQYQPCQYQDYVDFALAIFIAVIAAYFSWWGMMQIYNLLHWSRGGDN